MTMIDATVALGAGILISIWVSLSPWEIHLSSYANIMTQTAILFDAAWMLAIFHLHNDEYSIGRQIVRILLAISCS